VRRPRAIVHIKRSGLLLITPATLQPPPRPQDYLSRAEHGGDRETYGGLTARETEILTLIARGATDQEIGRQLFTSVQTVQTRRAHILEKLERHDRTQLVRYAIRKGPIEP
jgi:two-component system response regulator NreC